jgi:3D (Asp-Asp-Asp) domain-containing protein
MDIKTLKIKDIISIIVLVIIVAQIVILSELADAYESASDSSVAYIAIADEDKTEQASMLLSQTSLTPLSIPSFSFSGSAKVVQEMYVPVSAYNSEVAQTDNDPFTTANGDHVFDGGVAANFLPFGTKIKMPDHFGDKVFTVNDRMNKKYDKKVDIWMADKGDAIAWGVRNVRIQIIEG